jgi:hypothetical protein
LRRLSSKALFKAIANEKPDTPGRIFIDMGLAHDYRSLSCHQSASDASEAPMRPMQRVNPTSEHALFLRLFLTGGGGW